MRRISKREADAISARVDAQLSQLAQTSGDRPVTAYQISLWNQLGAHHRLRLRSENRKLYDRLQREA